MKYGFVIDNRKCIGCHACTTACKSEHEVAIGVNRTHVSYTEKGTFPDSRRVFSVMRCNHCTDAPCVEICPVEALYTRDDGIVDFDNDRCIGCKSCMQACPYDALYIDPNTSTAAKCNYCAHKIDVGLEPACVTVCPEHAIISGDMHNPDTEIARLLAKEQVTVRKEAKGTNPNLFYIDGDQAALNPMKTNATLDTLWSSQSKGVGHFAKKSMEWQNSNEDVLSTLRKEKDKNGRIIDLVEDKTKRSYDSPDKGVLWGWEVSGYILTKGIAAGVILVSAIGAAFGVQHGVEYYHWWILGSAMIFLLITGGLLVKDLDRPDRFLYVLFRPQWNSWLTKGSLIISVFGLITVLLGMSYLLRLDFMLNILGIILVIAAIGLAVYTAFLFAQAKGRDFWQSPTLAIHMVIHSILAGAAFISLTSVWIDYSTEFLGLLKNTMFAGIGLGLIVMLIELTITHPTMEAKKTVEMILKGRFKDKFWYGAILFGHILPVALLFLTPVTPLVMAIIGLITLVGIYLTEDIWVEAPQRIKLK